MEIKSFETKPIEAKPFEHPTWKYIMAAALAMSKVQMVQGSTNICSIAAPDENDETLAWERVHISFTSPLFEPYQCFADVVKEEFLKLEMLSNKEIAEKVYNEIFNNTLNNE